MKTSLPGPNAISRIRVFLIATCLIAITPRLSDDIVWNSRPVCLLAPTLARTSNADSTTTPCCSGRTRDE